MTKSIMSGSKNSVRAQNCAPDGARAVMERLLECGGTVTPAAPGPTYLVRSLWKDNAIRATDDRVQWCIELIRSKRIKCSLREAGASATYRIATPEEQAELD